MPVLDLNRARASWTEKVEGLNAGADDYIAKPSHVQEVAARLRALIRRAAGKPSATLVHDDIELSPAAGTVTVSGKPVELDRPGIPHLELFHAPSGPGDFPSRSDSRISIFRTKSAIPTRSRCTWRGCGASWAAARSRLCAASDIAWDESLASQELARARLVIGAFIWITIGVSAAGRFHLRLFRQHATALVDLEMFGHLEELASLIDISPEGTPVLYRPLSDPRFSLVGSGYSWQVSRNGRELIKSTSVSTADLPIPTDPLALYETLRLTMQNGPQSHDRLREPVIAGRGKRAVASSGECRFQRRRRGAAHVQHFAGRISRAACHRTHRCRGVAGGIRPPADVALKARALPRVGSGKPDACRAVSRLKCSPLSTT